MNIIRTYTITLDEREARTLKKVIGNADSGFEDDENNDAFYKKLGIDDDDWDAMCKIFDAIEEQ